MCLRIGSTAVGASLGRDTAGISCWKYVGVGVAGTVEVVLLLAGTLNVALARRWTRRLSSNMVSGVRMRWAIADLDIEWR